ncbi:40S ribosomal protein S21 [Aspergillus fumigatus]
MENEEGEIIDRYANGYASIQISISKVDSDRCTGENQLRSLRLQPCPWRGR